MFGFQGNFFGIVETNLTKYYSKNTPLHLNMKRNLRGIIICHALERKKGLNQL